MSASGKPMKDSAFVRNCWYVAAYADEVLATAPLQRVVLGEPLVLYRDKAGQVVALEDRCSHRFAPLSLGRIEGDGIRCLYHGLKFGPSGRCMEIPNQDTIPERAHIRSYPVREQDSWIWVWMGDEAGVDGLEPPRAVGADHLEWRVKSGQSIFEANWQLLNDNLCDLTHLAYVHPETLGKGAPAWSDCIPKVIRLPRGIRSERWLRGGSLSMPDGTALPVDQWNAYDFVAPGIFLIINSYYPVGTAEQVAGEAPEGIEALMSVHSSQAVTPESDRSTRYFYSIAAPRRVATDAIVDDLYELLVAAFLEDKRMEEAQQRIIDCDPDRQMMVIGTDKAITLMRQTMARIGRQEA